MKKFFLMLNVALLAAPSLAFADDVTATHGLISVGAGIGIGLAALGGALGQGKLVASGLESIGRNPGATGKLFVPLVLGLAFVESIVILAFVISFFLQGKV